MPTATDNSEFVNYILKGNTTSIKKIEICDVDPNYCDKSFGGDKSTALHYIARNGGYSVLASELVMAKADVDAKDAAGNTPLHLAAFCYPPQRFNDCQGDNIERGENCPRIMEVLLEAKANPDAVSSDGYTALHIAASCYSPVNAYEENSSLPDMTAHWMSLFITQSRADAVAQLVRANADVNLRSSNSRSSPLFYAALDNFSGDDRKQKYVYGSFHPARAKVLTQLLGSDRVDVKVKDRHGKGVLDYPIMDENRDQLIQYRKKQLLQLIADHRNVGFLRLLIIQFVENMGMSRSRSLEIDLNGTVSLLKRFTILSVEDFSVKPLKQDKSVPKKPVGEGDVGRCDGCLVM